MQCPVCHSDSKVLDTRWIEEETAIRRRRECMTTRRLPGTISLYGWTVVIFMVQRATVTGMVLWL